MQLPAGILQPTTPPPDDAGQGGPTPPAGDDGAAREPRAPKVRRKRPAAPAAEKLEGRRLYLSEGVHFRLRMLAYQRGVNISEAAQDVLDKALPKYDVNRVG
jgi:hypothetical protein